MSKIAEFEMPREADDAWHEWLVLYRCDGYVLFAHEYLKPESTERETWCDRGSGVNDEHLRGVIAALQSVQSESAAK